MTLAVPRDVERVVTLTAREYFLVNVLRDDATIATNGGEDLFEGRYTFAEIFEIGLRQLLGAERMEKLLAGARWRVVDRSGREIRP